MDQTARRGNVTPLSEHTHLNEWCEVSKEWWQNVWVGQKEWWATKDLNLGPLPCEGNALTN